MKKKTCIWCISKYASPPNYGVGAKLFVIAKKFSEMNIDTVLISSDSNHLAKYPQVKDEYNYEKYGKLLHLWIKTYKYNTSASIKRILSWLDFEFKLFKLNKENLGKPDIVIISSLSLLTILNGIYFKKKYGSKLVFEIRDIYPLTLTEEFGFSKWNPAILFLRYIEKIGYKKSELIIGTMPNLKEHVQEILGYEKPVFYSPIGIHSIWSNQAEKSEEVDALFASAKKFIVGYSGSMGISNALDCFINAIQSMVKYEDIHFVLVGDGDLKQIYIEKLTGLNNVTIGPKIKQSEVPYFLSKCDVLYLATRDSKIWRYGQSMNKIIDYMMAAKPVIAAYSGYQSMLNEANSGLFIPTDDVDATIEAVLFFKNMIADERNKYGLRGRKWVEDNHSYESIFQRYYEKVMELVN